MVTESQLSKLMAELADLLTARAYKMASAESCTGGWLAKAATDLAGSSGWFDRGLVTYSNQAKHEVLAVSESTLDQYGAVSQETVHEMVAALLSVKSVSLGVAISGIAGPGGGSADKPVGTVWLAWKMLQQPIISKRYNFKGDRQQVRLQATIEAVAGLISLLKSHQ